jgi:hypothetical protein
MYFVFIWEQTATCASCIINWLVLITEIKSVYSAVRTGALNEAVCACATYSTNWLLFITQMKSVYSAVRTGALNEAVCACATHSINWLVFITEMKSVYSAVRTGALSEAVCAPSFKVQNLTSIKGTSHENRWTFFFITSRLIHIRIRNISAKIVEKIKTRIFCSITFPEKSIHLWDKVIYRHAPRH